MSEPLTPAGSDLRNLPWMPLHVGRLIASEWWICASGDAVKVAVELWCASWHQVPAASLPDNDRMLARMCGLSLDEWARVRGEVMSAWVKCTDGRWYHPTVAEMARDAWERKLKDAGIREARRQAGKLGGRPAKEPEGKSEAETNASDDGNQTESKCFSNEKANALANEKQTITLQDKTRQDSRKKENSQSGPEPPPDHAPSPAPDHAFDEFWKIYPHPDNRGSKKHAARLFGKLKQPDRQALMEAIPVMRRKLMTDHKTGFARSPPMAQTYINQERWQTEFDQPAEIKRSQNDALLAMLRKE
jgi:uncharacterized protein YdaU (DUF1376 family)